ncbi:hypothetical protein NC653_010336 [Populus alba x Populus x berolinensis]|uniref:Uncharacterized protein n=1 Tax=Populus alba x Populus x berolinensis TaxID=444605 RepID=A0AAD6QZV0_9ROSI|nr:hypothetical protein NC653_010336 [Populus alba x Populus x berolinensis]
MRYGYCIVLSPSWIHHESVIVMEYSECSKELRFSMLFNSSTLSEYPVYSMSNIMLQVYTTVISSLWNMVHDVAGFNQGNYQSVLCFPIERVSVAKKKRTLLGSRTQEGDARLKLFLLMHLPSGVPLMLPVVIHFHQLPNNKCTCLQQWWVTNKMDDALLSRPPNLHQLNLNLSCSPYQSRFGNTLKKIHLSLKNRDNSIYSFSKNLSENGDMYTIIMTAQPTWTWPPHKIIRACNAKLIPLGEAEATIASLSQR